MWQVINGTDSVSLIIKGQPLLVVLWVGPAPCCWSSWHLEGQQKQAVNQAQIKGSNQCYLMTGRACIEFVCKNEIQKPDSHLLHSPLTPHQWGKRSYNTVFPLLSWRVGCQLSWTNELCYSACSLLPNTTQRGSLTALCRLKHRWISYFKAPRVPTGSTLKLWHTERLPSERRNPEADFYHREVNSGWHITSWQGIAVHRVPTLS